MGSRVMLEGEVAAKLMESGEVLDIDLGSFIRTFGHKEGIRQALARGELTATGKPDGHGNWTDITIRSDDAVKLLAKLMAHDHLR